MRAASDTTHGARIIYNATSVWRRVGVMVVR